LEAHDAGLMCAVGSAQVAVALSLSPKVVVHVIYLDSCDLAFLGHRLARSFVYVSTRRLTLVSNEHRIMYLKPQVLRSGFRP